MCLDCGHSPILGGKEYTLDLVLSNAESNIRGVVDFTMRLCVPTQITIRGRGHGRRMSDELCRDRDQAPRFDHPLFSTLF